MGVFNRWVAAGACMLAIAGGFANSVARAQSTSTAASAIDAHLASGEFGAARRIIAELPVEDQDAHRARLAIALAAVGLHGAAVDAIDKMGDTDLVRQTLGAVARPKFTTGGVASGGPSPGIAIGSGGRADAVQGSPGGGAIADFDSLIDLIQTTVAPVTWEVLGGPSTIAEYRAGIHVDPDGLVRDVVPVRSDRLTNLRARILDDRSPQSGRSNVDWTQPSDLRVVSLAALRHSLLRHRVNAQSPTAEMRNLAGLSTVRYVIITDEDIFLAGPVGGIDPAGEPWPRDQQTGMTTLGLDVLVASASAVRAGVSYGCSIDPTEQGLAAAARVAERIGQRQQPSATAADALAAALGRQNISLFHVAGDQPLAWLLVDADRHMKQLALGVHQMPNGVFNYLDIVEQHVQNNPAAGAPGGQLLRMWFAANPKQVRRSSDARTFELAGLPIRLMSARELAGDNGNRQQAGRDPVGEAFAAHFTEHFRAIAAEYPVYGRLRGAFELTAAMQLVKQQVGPEAFDRLVGELAVPEIFHSASVSVPRQCESMAVRHTIRAGRERHDVYVASGGVQIDPATALVSHVTVYPQLDVLSDGLGDRPLENTRWWWDR